MKNTLIFPMSNAKERLHRDGGVESQEALAQSEQRIDKLKPDYEEWLHEDLEALEKLSASFLANATPKTHEEISKKIHFVRGEGSTFGYIFITKIASSLSVFFENCPPNTMLSHQLIFIHIQALRKAVDHHIQDPESNEARAILSWLQARIDKNFPA